MIVVTGAAGFIGSNLVAALNKELLMDVIVVDEFSREDKLRNLKRKAYEAQVDRFEFFNWAKGKKKFIQFVVHLGARTDTTEQNAQLLEQLNTDYSKKIWKMCVKHRIPLIYASSAATYGGGEHGFSDDESLIPQLKPLNPYGRSKQLFDQWVLEQEEQPPFWAGLKFFNVYGPNEYHKGRMASVIWHAYNQIAETGELKLFRSHRKDVADGEQMRDFICVADVVAVIRYLMKEKPASGIYNLGTGKARSFNDLGKAVFNAMHLPPRIRYVDIPEDIRETYQYYTEAEMEKLRKQAGYKAEFTELEDGVMDYVRNFLIPGKYN